MFWIEAVRTIGIAVAVVIAVLGVYLPLVGALDWALLPFLLAMSAYMLFDMVAMAIEARGIPAGNPGIHRAPSPGGRKAE